MPRVSLFNIIFHLRKISAKLMLNSWKTIISHFYISLNNSISNNFPFRPFFHCWMRKKLWPKAPAKEGALGQVSNNFQVHFIHINFFEKRNKKMYNGTIELYCNATIFVFWFFIVYLPKKNGNWKMGQVCRLSPNFCFVLFSIENSM